MGLFSKGKSAIQKLQEEKQKIENKLALKKLNEVNQQKKVFRMADESADDYLRKLQNARRTGRY